ncbi:glycosyltransferase family 2 protein [soil metagenome]
MKLSVIIVSYNVRYFLEQALLSVRKAAAGLEVEVLVVDNHSRDGSGEMVRQLFPEVRLITNAENVGFAKANNQAIRQARGAYVLLLNPDTVVEEEAFARCCHFMEAHPEAGALGVNMIDGCGRFLPESKRGLPTPEVAFYHVFGISSLWPASRLFGRYHLGFLDQQQVHAVEVLSGAFMFIRRSVLDQVGLLDEDYFLYGEDVDLSYRIGRAGYTNYYFPQVRIIHFKGKSTQKEAIGYVRMFYEAMAIFARKHFSADRARLVSLLIQLGIYFRASLAAGARLPRLASRWVRHLPLPRSKPRRKRIAFVGSPEETERGLDLLRQAGVRASVLGLVSTGPLPLPPAHHLGEKGELAELIRKHGLTELVFCGKDLSYESIIQIMAELAEASVEFKILPAGGAYMLGSSSRSGPGAFYGFPLS